MAETNGFSSPFKGPSIEGMHVIVTGAAGGIGKATALLLYVTPYYLCNV